MPYTPNYAPGDVLTAAAMNSIGEAWSTFGSGTNWKAATTNPALGNGTWTGYYQQINKTVFVRVRIKMGSTTTYGTGDYRIDLPVTAKTTGWQNGDPLGLFQAYDATATAIYGGQVLWLSSTQVSAAYYGNIAGTLFLSNVNKDNPFTLATNDEIKFYFTYEAA